MIPLHVSSLFRNTRARLLLSTPGRSLSSNIDQGGITSHSALSPCSSLHQELDQDPPAPHVLSLNHLPNRDHGHVQVRSHHGTHLQIFSVPVINNILGRSSEFTFARSLPAVHSSHPAPDFCSLRCFLPKQHSPERSLHTSTAVRDATIYRTPRVPSRQSRDVLSQQPHEPATNTTPFPVINSQATLTTSNATAATLMLAKFGHAAFRGIQLPAIMNILKGGDALALMTTGSGKSLIYQVGCRSCMPLTIICSSLPKNCVVYRRCCEDWAAVHT